MNRQKHIRFDWAIKKLLRQKANFEILEGFLSELLKEDIFIQEILESESNQDHEYDKQNRVDILVKNTRDELMLIEVQNEREHDYFHRMLFGASKLITQFLVKGKPYSEVKKVYSINIVYFDLGQGQDYIYQGNTEFIGIHKGDVLALSHKQKEIYDLAMPQQIFPTYFVLKLNSFDDIAKDTLDEWIYFLKNSEIKDEFKAKGLAKAKEQLREDSLSDPELWAYEAYIKDQRIRQNEIETAIFDERHRIEQEVAAQLAEAKAKTDEAFAKAILAQEKITQSVIKMHQRQMSHTEIAEVLNLSVEEIKVILKE